MINSVTFKKTNFILILSVLIIAISCNRKTSKTVDEVEVFQFPRIIDRFKADTLKLTSENGLNYGDHNPYYLGKLSDTISMERYLRPNSLPPRADTTKPKKGKFDDYFLDLMDNRKFKRRDSVELLIKIDTTQIINNKGRRAYPVLIKNQSIDTIYIGYGNQIPIITEAKTQDGQWKPIEERFDYMCGVGLHSIILPPNEIVITSELVYAGKFKTKLRIKMGRNYSDEFDGKINDSQFESEWDSNETEPEVEEGKGFQRSKNSKCDSLDVSINNSIVLNDSESIMKSFGTINKPWGLDDKMYYLSADSSQYITLSVNHGGGIGEYRKARIRYTKKKLDKKSLEIPKEAKSFFEMNRPHSDDYKKFYFTNSKFPSFVSSMGIKLGLSIEQFKGLPIFSNTNETIINNKVVFKFEDDYCLYNSEFIFENNELIDFSFGFINP